MKRSSKRELKRTAGGRREWQGDNDNGDPPECNVHLPDLSDLPSAVTDQHPSQPDVLLLTVEDCEFLSCYVYLHNPLKHYFHGLGHVYFGIIGDEEHKHVKVALMRCHKGSVGPGSSLITVKDAVTSLQPKAVISVGYCSGMNREKAKLGDVVVCAKLTTYASKIVLDTEEQSTGTRTVVSRNFLKLIKHIADGWKAPMKNSKTPGAEVHTDGEFLSGPDKVNADWRRAELLKEYPQADAIEQEGEGVFTAAVDLGIEWLLVKGITDFADGTDTRSSWKRFASVMAASVVSHLLSDPNVFKNWPHFQESTREKLREMKGEIQMDDLVSGPQPKKRSRMEGSSGVYPSHSLVEYGQCPFPSASVTERKSVQQRGPVQEQVPPLTKSEEPAITSQCPESPSLPDYPEQLVELIRREYKGAVLCPFPWCEDELQFELSKIFTRLMIVARKKERAKLTKDLVRMTDVFRPLKKCSCNSQCKCKREKPRVVLIAGPPGMGKTTYCQKLAYDWSVEDITTESFPNVDMLFRLTCRDMKTANIEDAIDDQLLPLIVDKKDKEKFFHFIRHNQNRILLVVDGLDELPKNLFEEFLPLIKGRVFPLTYVMLTARHEAGMKVRRHCDALFEIVGYTEKDACNYIVKYFGNHEKPRLAIKLIEEINRDSQLRELTANALNTALLCLVFEDTGGILPHNKTTLYCELVNCVLRRYCSKKEISLGYQDPVEKYTDQLNQ